MRAATQHRDLEFVIVYDSATHPATVAALLEVPDLDLVLVPFDGSAPPAALLNRGALHASGEALVFLDDRTEAASDEPIGRLIAALSLPDVGMAGAKLLSDDGTIHHAGLTVTDGQVIRPWHGLPDTAETSPSLFHDQTVDGLDGTCVAVDVQTFVKIGGWSEEVPDRYRDLDLGFKIRREGLSLRWTAGAVLWDFTSGSGHSEPRRWEIDFMTRRWGSDLVPTVREPAEA